MLTERKNYCFYYIYNVIIYCFQSHRVLWSADSVTFSSSISPLLASLPFLTHSMRVPAMSFWQFLESALNFLAPSVQFSSVQSLSHVWLFVIPRTAARQASLSITNSQSLPKLTSIESVMPSNHLILCCPHLHLPSIFPSIRVFSSESALRIRWTNYWSFSFDISPSNEYPGLISFGLGWLDLLAVRGTLKSILKHHSSKASILWCSAFFIIQLSYPYMTTGKNIALTRRTFVDKVMPLFFNMLSAAAAAAKSPQSSPTLCDPTDGSPSGSPFHGILQARTLEWVAISFSNA